MILMMDDMLMILINIYYINDINDINDVNDVNDGWPYPTPNVLTCFDCGKGGHRNLTPEAGLKMFRVPIDRKILRS